MFEYEHFSCDVDIFRTENDLIVRFYDRLMEQSEQEIVDLVIVEPGYGYICLKFKGNDGLLSGFLDKKVFSKLLRTGIYLTGDRENTNLD